MSQKCRLKTLTAFLALSCCVFLQSAERNIRLPYCFIWRNQPHLKMSVRYTDILAHGHKNETYRPSHDDIYDSIGMLV